MSFSNHSKALSNSRRGFLKGAMAAAGVAACLPVATAFRTATAFGNQEKNKKGWKYLELPEAFDWHPESLLMRWNPGNYINYSIDLPRIFQKKKIYVSSSGDDSNKGFIDQPIRTLIRGVVLAEEFGGAEIILDGSSILGWGNRPTTVPIKITGNGSRIIPFGQWALRFDADYHITGLVVQGKGVIAIGTGIRGLTEKCIFRNCTGSGLEHNGSFSEFYVVNCTSHDNLSDGFAHSSGNNSVPNYVFEANNLAFNNGDGPPSQSDQGSTTHTGVRSIRLGCVYFNNNNNICDVGVSKNFIVECVGHTSKNGTLNVCVGGGSEPVTSWMYGGNFKGGANWDLSVRPNSVLYSNLKFDGYAITPDSNIQYDDP